MAAMARADLESARSRAKRFAAHRDVVMLCTASFTGTRVSELCKLMVENVDLAGRVLQVKRGKGDKDRNIPIAKKLLPVLAVWIGERKTGPLFPGPSGRALSRWTFYDRLKDLARRAGITKRVYPHLLRHTFATSLIDTGSPLHEVQELMGHADIQTTAIYLHVSVQRLQSSVDRL